MTDYLLGLATLPGLALLYVVVVFVSSRVASKLLDAVGWTLHRIKPGAPIIQAKIRAAVVYSARSGLVIAAGPFAVVVISGRDMERHTWAAEALTEPLRTIRGSEAKRDLQVGNSCPTPLLEAIIDINIP